MYLYHSLTWVIVHNELLILLQYSLGQIQQLIWIIFTLWKCFIALIVFSFFMLIWKQSEFVFDERHHKIDTNKKGGNIWCNIQQDSKRQN